MRNDIPYEYGSGLYWFCAWGKRIEQRLEKDHDLHRWDCGVFRPDHSASKALSEYSLRYPQVVNRVNDALAHVENLFAEIGNADFDQNELSYRFEALAKRIANASQTIGSAIDELKNQEIVLLSRPKGKRPARLDGDSAVCQPWIDWENAIFHYVDGFKVPAGKCWDDQAKKTAIQKSGVDGLSEFKALHKRTKKRLSEANAKIKSASAKIH